MEDSVDNLVRVGDSVRVLKPRHLAGREGTVAHVWAEHGLDGPIAVCTVRFRFGQVDLRCSAVLGTNLVLA
jgi:hypothetical protein